MVDKYKVFVYNIGISKRKDCNNGGLGFKSSIIHLYERNLVIYVFQIEENKCTLEIYQDFQIKKNLKSQQQTKFGSYYTSFKNAKNQNFLGWKILKFKILFIKIICPNVHGIIGMITVKN